MITRPLAYFTAISVALHVALFGLWTEPDSAVKRRLENSIEIGLVRLPRIDRDNSHDQNLSQYQPKSTASNRAERPVVPESRSFDKPHTVMVQETEPLRASQAAPTMVPLDLSAAEGTRQPVTETPNTSPGQSPTVAVEAAPLNASNPAPPYPAEALRHGWEGEVWLKVDVNRHGAVSKVSVDRSSGYPVLDRAAADTVNSWQFEPAKVGSEAVDGTVHIPVRFKIKRT